MSSHTSNINIFITYLIGLNRGGSLLGEKITVGGTDYRLFKILSGSYNPELWDLFCARSLREIRKAFQDSKMEQKYKCKIYTFLTNLMTESGTISTQKEVDILKIQMSSTQIEVIKVPDKIDVLETKLSKIEDKLTLLVSALDLQNQTKI